MALRIPTFMSPQEYLEFEETSPAKHQYVDGILYKIPGKSIDNNEIAGNIYTALRSSARSNQCRIEIEGVKLWIPRFNRYYYPDVMVLCDTRDKDPKIFQYPCLVVEVLSPSTAATDRREKLEAYRTIETLQTYWIVDGTDKVIDVFERTANGWSSNRISHGELKVASLQTSLSIESIFDIPANSAE
jgi:Uma2 family endonuclease